jgi:hypothetical protein
MSTAIAAPLDRKMTVRIPDDIYIKAKTHCVVNRIDLQDVVAKALRVYLSSAKRGSLHPRTETHSA